MEVAQNRLIMDTDILVDVLRNVEKTVRFVEELESKGCMISTTVVNVFELYYGAYKSSKRLENLAAVRKLVEKMTILKMGIRSAEEAGNINAELEAEGEPIDIRDIIISAIAITKEHTLVTRNIRHLKRIKKLNLMAAP